MTKTSTTNRHGSAVVTQPSDTDILITRMFDAPAALVYEAVTTPELVKRWWGFEDSEWLACDIDLRVGGQWRYAVRNGDSDAAWHGEYREIEPSRRIVSTEVFEPFPDAVAFNTMTLDEVDGVTTLTTLVHHSSRANRDGHLNAGMEGGMQISFNRLEDLVRQAA